MEMQIHDFKIGAASGLYQPVEVATNRGSVACRYYAVQGTHRAALWVGEAGGGWDSPARGLYEQLCQELLQDSIASLRVRYRHANNLEECVLDVLAGLAFLDGQGIEAVALVGHSFGGAVMASAAAASSLVRTVLPMSTQTYGV